MVDLRALGVRVKPCYASGWVLVDHALGALWAVYGVRGRLFLLCVELLGLIGKQALVTPSAKGIMPGPCDSD